MTRVCDDSFFHLAAAANPPLRRKLNDFEIRARTDFVRMQDEWESIVNATFRDIRPIRAEQVEHLSNQVFQAAQSDDLDDLNLITLDDELIFEALLEHMTNAAIQAGVQQQKEAEAQGVDVPDWNIDGLTAAFGTDLLRSTASVTARIINNSFIQSAVRKALSLIGRPQVSPEQVSDDVEQHLRDLSDASVRESIGGAITTAQNEGRRTVLVVAPPASEYVASEILDRNVCGPCRDIDGRSFSTLANALEQYPSGGYKDCLGGIRCRGTIVAVWDEEE